MKWLALVPVFLMSCMGHSADSDIAIEALRLQLADVDRTTHTYQTELEILEERVNRQQGEVESSMAKRVKALEGRLSGIEKKQQAFLKDLRSIAKAQERAASEHEQQIAQLTKAMDSVVKLARHSTTVTVQSGDTLEKIARREGTTIRALKESNKLKNDIIYAGQKLRLP